MAVDYGDVMAVDYCGVMAVDYCDVMAVDYGDVMAVDYCDVMAVDYGDVMAVDYCDVMAVDYCDVMAVDYCDVMAVDYCDVMAVDYCDVMAVDYCDVMAVDYCDVMAVDYCDVMAVDYCDVMAVDYCDVMEVDYCDVMEVDYCDVMAVDYCDVMAVDYCDVMAVDYCDVMAVDYCDVMAVDYCDVMAVDYCDVMAVDYCDVMAVDYCDVMAVDYCDVMAVDYCDVMAVDYCDVMAVDYCDVMAVDYCDVMAVDYCDVMAVDYCDVMAVDYCDVMAVDYCDVMAVDYCDVMAVDYCDVMAVDYCDVMAVDYCDVMAVDYCDVMAVDYCDVMAVDYCDVMAVDYCDVMAVDYCEPHFRVINIATVLDARANTITTVVDSRANKITTVVDSRANNITTVVDSRANNINTVVDSRTDNITTVVDSRADNIITVVDSRADNIITVVDSRANNITTVIFSVKIIMDNNAFALFSGSVLPESSVSKPKRRRKMLRKGEMVLSSGPLDKAQYKVLGNFGEVECKKRRSQQFQEENLNHDFGFSRDMSTSFQVDRSQSKHICMDALQSTTNKTSQLCGNPATWANSRGISHSTDNGYEFSNLMFNTENSHQNFSRHSEGVMFDALLTDQVGNRSDFQCQQRSVKNYAQNVSVVATNTENKQTAERAGNEVAQLDSFTLILKDLMESASPFEPENSCPSIQYGDDSLVHRQTVENTTGRNPVEPIASSGYSVPLVPLISSTPNAVKILPSHHSVPSGPSRADPSLAVSQRDSLSITSYQNCHVPLTSSQHGTHVQTHSMPSTLSKRHSVPLNESQGLVPVTSSRKHPASQTPSDRQPGLQRSSKGHSLPSTTVQGLIPLQSNLNNSVSQVTPQGLTVPETSSQRLTMTNICMPTISAPVCSVPMNMTQKPAQMMPTNINSPGQTIQQVSSQDYLINQQRRERLLQMLMQKQSMKRIRESGATLGQHQNGQELTQILQNGHSFAQISTAQSPPFSDISASNRPVHQLSTPKKTMGWLQSALQHIQNGQAFDQGLKNGYSAAQTMAPTIPSRCPPSSDKLVSTPPRPSQNGHSFDQGLQNVNSAAPSVSAQNPPLRSNLASTTTRQTHQPNRSLYMEPEKYFIAGDDLLSYEGSFMDQLNTPSTTSFLLDTSNSTSTDYTQRYNTSTQVDYLTDTPTFSPGQHSGSTPMQTSNYIPSTSANKGQIYVNGQPNYRPLSNTTTADVVSTTTATPCLTAPECVSTQTRALSPNRFSVLSAPRKNKDSMLDYMKLTNQTSPIASSQDEDGDLLSDNCDSFYLNSLPSICYA
ncbi:hypothetical protein Btru_036095 [Bulinus truncatus]|nr:hypothetical protein Btru_036095 [Bulinus truncatus]